MSLNGDLNLSVESKYGHGELIRTENTVTDKNDVQKTNIQYYGKIPNDNTQRKLGY
jgi:hypothetical protein